jgi:hypothetical protein
VTRNDSFSNERKYNKIIVDCIVREWIGFDWIDLDKATEEDNQKYPTLVDG